MAGFDVYGNVGHQLESRLYMDFLRMEGEQNFLLLLPQEQRKALRNHWYRGAQDHVREFLMSPDTARYERDTAIDYKTDDPKRELMNLFLAHVPAARSARYQVGIPELNLLMAGPNESFSYLPEVAFLQVITGRGDKRSYSLLHNRAHSNNAQMFEEEERLVPKEDTLTVVEGFIGAYPNMFFQINEGDIAKFVAALSALESDADYTTLVDRFGVRRTAPWFWKLSDDFTAAYRAAHPVEAGLFDLNRYQNR